MEICEETGRNSRVKTFIVSSGDRLVTDADQSGEEIGNGDLLTYAEFRTVVT